jgi:hypothetical protein
VHQGGCVAALTNAEPYEDIGIKPPKVSAVLSLALFCIHTVWCMPSTMAKGLRKIALETRRALMRAKGFVVC